MRLKFPGCNPILTPWPRTTRIGPAPAQRYSPMTKTLFFQSGVEFWDADFWIRDFAFQTQPNCEIFIPLLQMFRVKLNFVGVQTQLYYLLPTVSLICPCTQLWSVQTWDDEITECGVFKLFPPVWLHKVHTCWLVAPARGVPWIADCRVFLVQAQFIGNTVLVMRPYVRGVPTQFLHSDQSRNTLLHVTSMILNFKTSHRLWRH